MLNLPLIRTSAENRRSIASGMRSVVVASIAVFFFLPGAVTIAWAHPPAVLESAPDFALKSSAGHNLRLSEFRGNVVIVNFWSIHCGHCGEQLDQLNTINAANRPNSISILSINVDRDSHAALRTIAERNLEFPVLFDTDKTAVRLYDPGRLPMTVMIDPHGTIRYIHDGYKRGNEALYTREIAELLAE